MRFKTLSTTSEGGACVRITADSPEDMWFVFNIIQEGDLIKGVADRKVSRDTAGGSSVERITVRLAIAVTDVSFDPDTGLLRVSGSNKTENDFVRLGAHHTLELEPHRSFDLEKACFDSLHWEQLKEGRERPGTTDVAAIVMDQGIAYICSIGAAMTVVRAKIETAVPKKRPGVSVALGVLLTFYMAGLYTTAPQVSQHERGVARFHEAVLAGLLRHVEWDKIKAIIIASPRFVKVQNTRQNRCRRQGIRVYTSGVRFAAGRLFCVYDGGGVSEGPAPSAGGPRVRAPCPACNCNLAGCLSRCALQALCACACLRWPPQSSPGEG